MAKRVIIEEDVCIGCESCVEICPSVFAFDEEESKAFVIIGSDPEEACVDEAIASCPVECISKK